MTAALAPFLRDAGWQDAAQTPLAGDASARRYLRLARGADSAILMQAPVTSMADRDSLAAFLRIGAHLAALDLSAPQIIAADPALGFILLEDFGDATLARLLRDAPAHAQAAYLVASDVTEALAQAALPDPIARPDPKAQANMIALTLDFLPKGHGLAALEPMLATALATHAAGPLVLALRDYHADNLLWLPDRQGAARIGLLDFQDAVALPLGYDLASLVDDPRRDIPADWRAALIARFAASHGLTQDQANARIATLSLLRNLRILGIFHRLAGQGGKPHYRAYLPRTGVLIDRAVADPALAALRPAVAALRALTAPWAEGAVA
ncbi:aminoglycoside phosphotransferase family protein [Roseicyclus sp.]|uniref:aminoglycoside phosphotransferase family protein n=1 Tax=Roseicyclus sp. TaxID=1914329 RepID=UPI003F6A0235